MQADQFALLDAGGVADDDVGEFVQSLIAHDAPPVH
jgi:hypothetical protein